MAALLLALYGYCHEAYLPRAASWPEVALRWSILVCIGWQLVIFSHLIRRARSSSGKAE